MIKKKTDTQSYWNARSLKFANYYENPTRFDLIFRKGIFRRFDRAVKLCNSFENPTILDIGSGPGINSVNLLKLVKGSNVTGIDFAPNMNTYAEEFAKLNSVSDSCEFIEGDFLEYEWKGKKFDVTLALGVFDYVDRPEDFIIKMSNTTKKAFLISWPNNGLRMLLRKIRYTIPVHHYSENEILELHDKCSAVKKVIVYKGSAGFASVAYL